MYKKILLPTDGSGYAEKAEKHALFLADVSGAEILALSVVENSYFVGLPADDTIFHVNEMLKQETEKNLEKVEKMKEEVHSDVKITLKVEEGSPADIILDTIDKEDIDLVVIGSSGKSGFDRFIMGSVADKVVKAAKCSVLVIH
jgi:nucleotide-binding universal stress UspA family protein